MNWFFTVNKRQVIQFISMLALCLLPACNSIPGGTAPDGPLITDNTATSTILENGKAAVNRMTVSLAVKCAPIANAGNKRPVIMNDFTASPKEVNELQFEVWRNLKKMNLITPSVDPDSNPEYVLSSEIRKSGLLGTDRTVFLWEMSLKKQSSGKVFWHESIEFFSSPNLSH